MDNITKEQRRIIMQTVKSKGSEIEDMLAHELWKRGYRYRRNNKTVYGKPDLTFKKYKIAIFVDGDFWHGKEWATKGRIPKSNHDFWYKKIERNIERDIEVNEYLTQNGWYVLRFWGSDIEKNLTLCASKIEDLINERKSI